MRGFDGMEHIDIMIGTATIFSSTHRPTPTTTARSYKQDLGVSTESANQQIFTFTQLMGDEKIRILLLSHLNEHYIEKMEAMMIKDGEFDAGGE